MKEYLGDSVYVEIVNGMFMLTTDNGEGPVETIYLEPAVLANLVKYAEKVMG